MKIRFSILRLVLIASTLLGACSPKATPTLVATEPPTLTPTPVPPTATSIPTTSRITGRVFIFPSDKSLEGAIVTLADVALKQPVAQAIADEAGQYLLEGVKSGTYSLSVMWEFKDKADCPGSNMFAPIMLFQKTDGSYLLQMTAFSQFEIKAGEVSTCDIRVLCQ